MTRQRLYIDTMSEVFRRSNKVLVHVDKGSPMFYLPLDQMMKNMPKTALPEAADLPTASSPRASSEGDPSRSRSR